MIVRGAETLGEGYHHRRGEPHAEVEALRDAAARGAAVRGATLYVSLEPCDHTGLTPPCTSTVLANGISRVVIGTLDPNPRNAGSGVRRLRGAQVVVDVVDDERARELVAEFAVAIARPRPYLRLKMAASLDGCVAPQAGERHQLSGREAAVYVRELRTMHDAVLVGSRTVRIDDPLLTVRPPSARRKPYRRVVACQERVPAADAAVFAPVAGYGPTIVLAPGGLRSRFSALEDVAEVTSVGDADATALDLSRALQALRAFDVATILCEGGPTLAARLVAEDLVDRFDWLVAPAFLRNNRSVPVLDGGSAAATLRFDRVERLGRDVLLSGVPDRASSV